MEEWEVAGRTDHPWKGAKSDTEKIGIKRYKRVRENGRGEGDWKRSEWAVETRGVLVRKRRWERVLRRR